MESMKRRTPDVPTASRTGSGFSADVYGCHYREGLNAFFATLKEEDFEVVVVRSLNEITDDIYDLEEFVKTITDMGIWIYSLEVGPVPITVSHAEDFGDVYKRQAISRRQSMSW